MALDVYVGSLTRYYAGDWGKRRRQDRPGRAAGGPSPASLALPARRRRIASVSRLRCWRGAGRSMGRSRRIWRGRWRGTRTSEAPWFTRPAGLGRPSARWCCGRPMPSSQRCAGPPPCRRNGTTIDALVRSNAEGFRSRYSHLVRNVELWLPTTLDFTFEAEDVDGRRIIVGSSTTLRPPARRAQRRDLEDG